GVVRGRERVWVFVHVVLVLGRASVHAVFFVASRRRHTRSKRDWSSDVCSSDLTEKTQTELAKWMKVANAYIESQSIKVARFGDNMRNVAVTEGDKVEAAIQFGWTVDYFGIGDLVEEMDKVEEKEIDDLYEEFKTLYDFR